MELAMRYIILRCWRVILPLNLPPEINIGTVAVSDSLFHERVDACTRVLQLWEIHYIYSGIVYAYKSTSISGSRHGADVVLTVRVLHRPRGDTSVSHRRKNLYRVVPTVSLRALKVILCQTKLRLNVTHSGDTMIQKYGELGVKKFPFP